MLNKFHKIIHSKYLKIFRFVFFLRYLFAIFFISLGLFLLIPNFFNYEKRSELIKKHILKKYDLEIQDYDTIKFKILPLPNLHLEKVLMNFESSSNNLTVQNLKLFPKITSIYNFENFKSKKIILENNEITLNTLDFQLFVRKLLNQKNKLSINNLNLKITEKNKLVIKLEDINYTNFGYNKNEITGKVFGKKFKTQLNNDYSNINFNILNSGIGIVINFNKNAAGDKIKGSLKSKIVSTNLKLDFDYDGRKLNIYNSYFRNKSLSFKNKSKITLEPFMDINSNFIVEDLSQEFFDKIDFHTFLKFINVVKKINSKNDIYFNSKKFTQGLINEIKLKIDLAYGRLNYSKNFLIGRNLFQCKGDINFIEEYPLLIFNCLIDLKDKKFFFKKFAVKKKNNQGVLHLDVKGELNILNNKIKFKEIVINRNYKASKEDLKYYEVTFEEILFNESVLKIFNSKKIKDFILEIY